MDKINIRKRDSKGRFTIKGKGLNIVVILLALLGIVLLLLRGVEWGYTHEVIVQKPWDLSFKPLVVVEDRLPYVVLSPVARGVVADLDYSGLNEVEQMICDKWGLLECKIALAIQKAENSKQEEDVLNYNTNGTYDVGIMQINSIHWGSDYCGSLHDLTTVEANVECAYNIWDRADGEAGNNKGSWTPWTQFNNGVFMNNL